MNQLRFWITVLLVVGTPLLAQGVKTPPAIQKQVLSIQDRFAAVLEEECPNHLCSSVGCEVSRFDTLDQEQSSSLPGLGIEEPAATLQYKLRAVRCEFAYESSVEESFVSNLRQRLRSKVKLVGVSLQLVSRKLEPKVEARSEVARVSENGSVGQQLAQAVIPFIPWMMLAITLGFLALMGLWGYRRLGRPRPVKINQEEDATALTEPDPSPHMIMTKLESLQGMLKGDPKLVELSLKPLFETEDLAEICIFVRHFGPEHLQPFRDKPEFRMSLDALSVQFDQDDRHETGAELWRFLERMERRIVASKVRIDHQPLDEEFSFLGSLGVDELIGLLREIPEAEAVAAIAYAPRGLREAFFAASHPKFVAKFVEQLTAVDKLPDSFVRQTARKLQTLAEEKAEEFRKVDLNRVPLLEQALNSLPQENRKELWQDMSKQHPELIQSIAPRIFLDASLQMLPDDLLTETFLMVKPKSAAAYLAALDGGDDILERLKPKLKDSIARFRSAEAPDKALVNEAREVIASYVKDLDVHGKINLRRINAQLSD